MIRASSSCKLTNRGALQLVSVEVYRSKGTPLYSLIGLPCGSLATCARALPGPRCISEQMSRCELATARSA
eukprot:7390204-Prymnesium_polylepis.1